MNAKTITMYNSVPEITERDVVLISKKTDDGYSTNCVSFGTMKDNMLSSSMQQTLTALNFGDISDMQRQVASPLSGILSGDMEFGGTKSFSSLPVYTGSAELSDVQPGMLVTREMAGRLAVDQQVYIGSDSRIDCSPRNDEGYTHDETHVLTWSIPDNGTDSSEFIDQDGRVAGPLTCPQDGMLVCYGWLADNGNLNPQTCWVGLFGEIVNVDQETGERQSRFTALQVQPWIVGANSGSVQYVGFNVPVKKGLRLKVKTGFAVNGNGTGFGVDSSLMLRYKDYGHLINTFVGYIIN